MVYLARSARGIRLPRKQQRDRVLAMARARGGTVDAVDLAREMGLHVTTVRFHLNGLCDDGVLVRTTLPREGVGRPRTGYRIVEERLDYRLLAHMLAMELGRTVQTRAARAQEAGRSWAPRVVNSTDAEANSSDGAASGFALDEAAERVSEVFGRMGFEPELRAATDSQKLHRVIRLRACPIRELARTHPEVACQVHLGLLQGLIGESAGDAGATAPNAEVSARLEPFVEPELCLATIEADIIDRGHNG